MARKTIILPDCRPNFARLRSGTIHRVFLAVYARLLQDFVRHAVRIAKFDFGRDGQTSEFREGFVSKQANESTVQVRGKRESACVNQFSFSGPRTGCSVRISRHCKMIAGKNVWSNDCLNSCLSNMWSGVM